jgi:hypothetical protein
MIMKRLKEGQSSGLEFELNGRMEGSATPCPPCEFFPVVREVADL